MQTKTFPLLRKSFAAISKKSLWEFDIEVNQSGSNITYIGSHFAANKNVKSTFEILQQRLYELRFKRVYFKWHSGADATYYTLETPKDSEIQKD